VPTIGGGTFTQPTIAAGTFTQPVIAAGTFTQPVIAAGTFTQPTISWPANPPTIAGGSFTNPTFSGNALATHTHTITPSGTNGSSAVSGNTAYYKVIACKKD
jgi:hypothetical protein